jgi:hypothetical protein
MMARSWTIGLLSLLGGCSETVIDGRVVDARDMPLAGVNITAAGTVCSTVSDASGAFALECEPGSHTIVVSAAGYTSDEFTQSAPEKEHYDSGSHRLVRIPEHRGLHLFIDSAYTQMKSGRLRRELVEAGPIMHRSVCLDRERSEANTVEAGTHSLFDYEHSGWRPFKLDGNDCAYRDRKDEKHRWSEVYKNKPPYEVQEFNEGRSIVQVDLSPGEYFIADWKGFFVGADEREERHSYTGYWLHVE